MVAALVTETASCYCYWHSPWLSVINWQLPAFVSRTAVCICFAVLVCVCSILCVINT